MKSESHKQNRWAIRHGKIIIYEAQYAGSYVSLVLMVLFRMAAEKLD